MPRPVTGDGFGVAGGDGPHADGVVAALLALTEQLSAAHSHDDVARIVATTAIERLGASAGFVAVAPADGGALEMLSHVRSDQPRTQLCSLATTDQLPVVDAWRFGVPVLLRDATELYVRYPSLDRSRPSREALAALPLEVDGVRLGAINFTFATPQPFDAPQQQLLRVVAGLCSQALRRAQLSLDVERVRRDFAITVAHELRSPLTAVYAAAIALGDGLTSSRVARDTLVAVIVEQSDRLRRVVEHMDLAAALDDGARDGAVEPLKLAPLVGDVAEFQRRERDGSTRIRVEIEAGLTVVAEDARLRQVVMHLVENACKYSPAESEVLVVARRKGKLAQLRVLDSGPGLAEHDLERAFEKFYRVDAMQRNGISGIGLGLTVSRRLVEAMGGRIWLEPRSDDDSGLAACVELPAADA